MPESSVVIKALLNYCYCPCPRDDYEDPDADVSDPTYALEHHAELYVAADKYRILDFKGWAEQCLHAFIGFSNKSLKKRWTSSENQADDVWGARFHDLSNAVTTLLEHTREEDPVRRRLLDIEWGLFAFGEHRNTWVAILKENPGYAAESMAHQTTNDWVMERARRIEVDKKVAGLTMAAAREEAATFV